MNGSLIDDNYKFAHQLGHERLYHFESFKPEWLIATLRDQKLFCSDPSTFNDPWDCKPGFDVPTDPQEVENWIECLKITAKPGMDPQSSAESFQKLRADPSFRSETIVECSRLLAGELRKRRIYCLTPDPCSTLMWSHYGGSHRGICLEFRLDNKSLHEFLSSEICFFLSAMASSRYGG